MIRRIIGIVARWITILRGPAYYHSLYARMHKSQAFRGDTWRAHLRQLCESVPNLDEKVVLDFGCGPKGGLAAEYPDQVIPYDPYVSTYSTPPWDKKFDVVFSSDVLEHMTRLQIKQFLACVRSSDPAFVFLVASTRPAQKLLPNGVNAHLTIKPAFWWLNLVSHALGEQYIAILANADLVRDDVTLCFKRTSERRNEQTVPIGVAPNQDQSAEAVE